MILSATSSDYPKRDVGAQKKSQSELGMKVLQSNVSATTNVFNCSIYRVETKIMINSATKVSFIDRWFYESQIKIKFDFSFILLFTHVINWLPPFDKEWKKIQSHTWNWNQLGVGRRPILSPHRSCSQTSALQSFFVIFLYHCCTEDAHLANLNQLRHLSQL